MNNAYLIPMAALCLMAPARAQQNPTGLVRPGTAKAADTFTPLPAGAVKLKGGFLGARYDASERNRLLRVDEDDMLDAFERRNVPHQDWQGEHVGKFLHAATLTWATTHDARLKAKIDRVAKRLMATQEADGYLGTYPPAQRWTSWDVWCHKYDILGLLTYYQYTGSKEALATARRAGDLLLNTFGPGKRDLNQAGLHMGMAPDSVLEAIVLLHRATGDPRYLAFARYIVSNYDAPGGPAILATLDKGLGVDKVANGKAYEMLSNLNGLLELYRVQPTARVLRDVRHAWDDVRSHRLYITGSASAGEHFQPDHVLPTGEGAHICEVCVTVTWEQMNLQLLRLTGSPQFAEAAEQTIYNHLLAAQKPTGEAWSYYTPMEGRKAYSPATTCCLSSGPRGVALIPSLAVMQSRDGGLVVNLFNPLTATARLKGGTASLAVDTRYPIDGDVRIAVNPAKSGMQFPLRVRIPAWANGARVAVGGKTLPARAGTYFMVTRAWKRGDVVRLSIPMKARIVGDDASARLAGAENRRAALYGPLVLAMDTADNPQVRLPRQLGLESVEPKPVVDRLLATATPAIQFRAAAYVGGAADAKPLTLVPYADAGASGSRLIVWMARPGFQQQGAGSGSVLYAGTMSVSRRGNSEGDIADDDPTTYSVTWDTTKAAEDWYAVTMDAPKTIQRVVYMHGRSFHDGGWWDTSAGKPRIEVRKTADGPWVQVATLDSYPATTSAAMPDLKDGQAFEVRFEPVTAVAVRIIGVPAGGDVQTQAFSSCGELQAF